MVLLTDEKTPVNLELTKGTLYLLILIHFKLYSFIPFFLLLYLIL